MSDIPPNIVGSSAQAGYQQAEVSKARDAQRAGQSDAAKRGVKAIDDAGSTIETDDDDVAVFADAEGQGGEGRSAEEESNEDNAPDAKESGSGGVAALQKVAQKADIKLVPVILEAPEKEIGAADFINNLFSRDTSAVKEHPRPDPT